MNNQELAIDVFKHPLIQEILKRKLAESSVVNRLIVEEIMAEDDLEEAKSASQTISYAMTKYIKAANSEEERVAKMDEFMEKLTQGGLWGELIPNWSKKEEGVQNDIIDRAKTWKSKNHEKLKKALSSANSEQEIKQTIDSTAQSIENQVVDPVLQPADTDYSDATTDDPQTSNQKLTDMYLAQIEKRLKEAPQMDLELGTRADAALGLALIPFKIWAAAKDSTQLITGVNPLKWLSNEARNIMIKREKELMEKISEKAKADPAQFLGYVDQFKPKDTGANWIGELKPVGEVKRLIASLAESYDLIDPLQVVQLQNLAADETDTGVDVTDEEEAAPVVQVEEVIEVVDPVVQPESVETDVVEAPPVEQPEIDESMIGNMDEFFGQTDKPSFMGQLFLDEQADMLWGLVDNLNTILGKETSAGGGARTKALVEADEPEDPDMIPWTGRSKSSLKQEMAAFADLLRETKRIADAYKEHGGMESADARFDGTRLKEALTGPIRIDENGILGQVQLHCALLIDEIAQILKSHKATVEPIDEALSEEERQNAVQTIREAYNLLSELYVQSLKESLSSGYRQKEPKKEKEEEIVAEATEDVRSAEEVATEMLDIIVKNPGIAQFFPKAFVTSGGNIVTIGRAVERLDDEIKAFSKIMRNLYKTIKEVGIRRAHLTMAGAQLESLAKTIENNFGVPRLIKRSATKIIKQNLSQDQQPFSEEDDVSRAEREPIPLKISDTPEFQKLDQQRKDIVNKFIKFYNQVVYPMEEGVTYQKESNKILVSFAQKLNLRNSQLKKIFKRMGKKDSALFTRVIMKYPDLRKALEKYLGQQEDGEASDKASSRLRDRINKRITEQQIIDSLKPTIERMLQEY